MPEKDICEYIIEQDGCRGIPCEATRTKVWCPLWKGEYDCSDIDEKDNKIVQAQRWLDEHKEGTK